MKKLVSLIALIAFVFSIHAQSDNYKSGALLWKISGKDLKRPSYLLGTFHLKSGDYLDSIPGARTSLEASEQVIGEIEMNNIMSDAMLMQ